MLSRNSTRNTSLMSRALTRFAICATIVTLPVVVAACGDSASAPTEESVLVSSGSIPGAPIGSSNDTLPNRGPVVGIGLSPKQLGLQVDGLAQIIAFAVDAQGLPTSGGPSGKPTWTAGNPLIATVNADGQVHAIAPGSTKVYATWGGYKDSASVFVLAKSDTIVGRP